MENVIARLRQAVTDGNRLTRIAEESGVPFKTLQKIYYGDTEDPRLSTALKLDAYFAGRANCTPPQ